VHYRVANLLELPPAWRGGFDLVAEIITVQALPRSLRAAAIGGVRSLVAPGGTSLIGALGSWTAAITSSVPPWPLRRDEIDAFAADDLQAERVEVVPAPNQPGERRWRATFRSSTR
jgi:hypothetical protein